MQGLGACFHLQTRSRAPSQKYPQLCTVTTRTRNAPTQRRSRSISPLSLPCAASLPFLPPPTAGVGAEVPGAPCPLIPIIIMNSLQLAWGIPPPS